MKFDFDALCLSRNERTASDARYLYNKLGEHYYHRHSADISAPEVQIHITHRTTIGRFLNAASVFLKELWQRMVMPSAKWGHIPVRI